MYNKGLVDRFSLFSLTTLNAQGVNLKARKPIKTSLSFYFPGWKKNLPQYKLREWEGEKMMFAKFIQKVVGGISVEITDL